MADEAGRCSLITMIDMTNDDPNEQEELVSEEKPRGGVARFMVMKTSLRPLLYWVLLYSFSNILDSSRSAISTYMLLLQQFETTNMYSDVSIEVVSGDHPTEFPRATSWPSGKKVKNRRAISPIAKSMTDGCHPLNMELHGRTCWMQSITKIVFSHMILGLSCLYLLMCFSSPRRQWP